MYHSRPGVVYRFYFCAASLESEFLFVQRMVVGSTTSLFLCVLVLIPPTLSLRTAPSTIPYGLSRSRSVQCEKSQECPSGIAHTRRTKSLYVTLPSLSSDKDRIPKARKLSDMSTSEIVDGPGSVHKDQKQADDDKATAVGRPKLRVAIGDRVPARGDSPTADSPTSLYPDAQFTRSLSSEMHSPPRACHGSRAPCVFLSRHGQSQANVLDLIGMDMGLSPEGAKYAGRLGQWVQENLGLDGEPIIIIRSDMVRTSETVSGMTQNLRGEHQLEIRSALNEIHAGAFEGWTFTEFQQTAEHEYAARKSDKLRYRYPGGESYLDLLHRIDPVVKEIRQYGREGKDVLVVAHQATLRCVVARLTGMTDSDVNAVPCINIPLHTIVQVQREPDSGDEGESGLCKAKYNVVGNLRLL